MQHDRAWLEHMVNICREAKNELALERVVLASFFSAEKIQHTKIQHKICHTPAHIVNVQEKYVDKNQSLQGVLSTRTSVHTYYA